LSKSRSLYFPIPNIASSNIHLASPGFYHKNAPLAAPSLALLLRVDILVGSQAVLVLGLALLRRIGRSVVTEAPVLRELADAERTLSHFAALPPAAGAILTALLVDICALRILLLACIGTGITAARRRV
jgi:hypothetical protein